MQERVGGSNFGLSEDLEVLFLFFFFGLHMVTNKRGRGFVNYIFVLLSHGFPSLGAPAIANRILIV